jgi:hypothetical protein
MECQTLDTCFLGFFLFFSTCLGNVSNCDTFNFQAACVVASLKHSIEEEFDSCSSVP